jgi:hypothetical protein
MLKYWSIDFQRKYCDIGRHAMFITTPAEIQSVAWEGELFAPSVSFGGGPSKHPFVTIGQTEIWPVDKALENETSKKWTQPLGDAKYWLVRLACTLREPPHGVVITEATQTLYLRPQPNSAGEKNAYAQNLFPQRLGVEDKTTFNFALGPELGFADGSSIKAGELGATIEYRKVFPVIQAYGLGESTPSWIFKPHAANPLIGCQSVYAVLVARAPATGLRAHVEVTVTTQSALFGRMKYGTPTEARQHTEFSLM